MNFLNSLTQESAIASFTDFKTRMTEYVASWEVPIPVIVLSLVVVFCVHLGLKVLREGSAEKKLQDAMYEETGIDGKYHFSLPKEEKVMYNQMKAFLMFLKVNGKPPQPGAKLELNVEKAREIIRTKLDEEEKKKLRTVLMRWLIAVIDVLAQVERDRPGAARLYEKKLVSDEYWEGVQSCFQGSHEVIKEINGEAEFLEDGWGAQIFPQALQLWRVTKMREKQNE